MCDESRTHGVEWGKIQRLSQRITYHYESNTLVNGTSGDDFIDNAFAERVTIDSGDGNDTVNNFGNKDSILGGAGNDSVHNEGFTVTIDTGDGNDTVDNGPAFDVTIITGAGDDSVYGTGTVLMINTGDGNDTVRTVNKEITINGGKGNDFVSLGAAANNNLILYNDGDGDDTVYGFSDDDTLSIGGDIDSYSYKKSGNDLILTVGEGHLTLVGSADLPTSNIIPNDGWALIDSSEGTTLILQKATVANGTSNNETITTNKIDGDNTARLINGGGNDFISGGAGNDTLWGNSGADEFIYSSGDGDDIIYGFNQNDTLTLDGLDFTASYKNSALTLEFSSGSITFKNFKATTFHIDNDTYKISGSKFVKK